MTRGWTYQEGLLSKRRIFFTDEQVYFECDARHCFESTAPLLNKVFWEPSQKARIFSIGVKATGRHDFYKTVSEYSGRQLTYESDILNGVWGVLRTFQKSEYPIHHYWGVPVYAKQSGHEFIAGFTWDLVKPGRRRTGFPSWSWSGWIGQVKPGVLVKLEHTPSQHLHLPQPYRLSMRPDQLDPFSKPEESITVESPQDVLQINLPSALEGEISLLAEHVYGGTLTPYEKASLRYSATGGANLSRFLSITAWMTRATVSPGVHRVTIFSPRHSQGYDSIQWLPTLEETLPRSHKSPHTREPSRIAILLAAREPFHLKRKRASIVNTNDTDMAEGEAINASWVCLFLVAEDKEDCYERIGLAKFLFSSYPAGEDLQGLIQYLKLEKRELSLG